MIYLIEHFIRFYRPRWRVICIFLLFYSLIYTKYVNSSWCIEIKFHVNLVFVSRIHKMFISVCIKSSHGQIHRSSRHRRPGGRVWSYWHQGVWLPTVGDAGDVLVTILIIFTYYPLRPGARNPRDLGSEGADVHWRVEESHGGATRPQGDDLLPQVEILNVNLIKI